MYTNPRSRRRQNVASAVGLYFAMSACSGAIQSSQEQEPQLTVPSFVADAPIGPVFDLEQSRQEPAAAIDEGNGVTTKYYYSPEAGGYVNAYAEVIDEENGYRDSLYMGQMFCQEGELRMYVPFDLSNVVFSNFDQAAFDELSVATCSDGQFSEADFHVLIDPATAENLINPLA